MSKINIILNNLIAKIFKHLKKNELEIYLNWVLENMTIGIEKL